MENSSVLLLDSAFSCKEYVCTHTCMCAYLHAYVFVSISVYAEEETAPMEC